MVHRFVRVVSLGLLLALCTGCLRNQDNTVTIVLQGDSTLSWQIAEHLSPSLLDKADWSHISWSQWGRANTKITLAPIVDPESLRERVKFGNVTRINGRTVYVEVDHLRSTRPCSLFTGSEIHQRDVRLGTRKLYASRISDKKFGDKI